MTKPTALAPLPKPEFIANVDTANEEVVRVTNQFNALVGLEGRLTVAEASVVTITALLETANAANATATAAQVKAEAEVTRLTAENLVLKEKADKAGAQAIATIAAAGVTEPAKVKGTGNALAEDGKKSTEGLYGLQRAIAANVENQKPKA